MLTASLTPTSTSMLFFQGTTQQSGGAGAVLGDGLPCASGAVLRLGSKTVTAGIASYPVVGNPSVSVRGQIPASGATRQYQWSRPPPRFARPRRSTWPTG